MGKNELVLFGSKNKLRKIENYSITCYGQTIQATPTVKYLGLEIDQFLNGEQVALDIIKKSMLGWSFFTGRQIILPQKQRKLFI